MPSALNGFPMFTGSFGQHFIHATHPFVVVDRGEVCGSFGALEAAEQFIAKHGTYSGYILRHTGQKWVMAKDRLANPLLQKSKSRLSRHRRV